MIPVLHLRQLLRYEPETGKLFWLPRGSEFFSDGGHTAAHICERWNSRYARREAFTQTARNGYRKGAIFDVKYLAHRVIWALVHGELPVKHIDHINGDKADNRIVNLREATAAENGRNRGAPVNNVSGHKGVNWNKQSSKWQAKIGNNCKTIFLGNFENIEAAAAAYAKASAELHGEFGRWK